MLIERNIKKYVVNEKESLMNTLEKINSNKKRIVFVVSNHGNLLGSFSDGDLRRSITNNKNLDLNKSVSSFMNLNYKYENISNIKNVSKDIFTKGIDAIPLVDNSNRLSAIIFNRDDGFVIGDKNISETSSCFIIAEIGNNHNGDINLAKRLVDLAIESGADCAKFQMRNTEALYKNSNLSDSSADLGSQYTMDLLSKFQLTNDELIEVFDYCKSKGIPPLCTPWDMKSLSILEDYGMEFYKVASADFTNHELLLALTETKKPLICSTGMCTELEIKKTTEFLKSKGAIFALLHCNSTYPSPFKDINLKYIEKLSELTNSVVGYSGHERGITVPIAAVALGAKIIEKHFTIDKTLEGNDHKVSLLPDEFKKMVKDIRIIEESLGTDGERELSQGELLNRETLSKSIIAKENIPLGTKITRDILDIKSPGQGLQPIYIEDLIGKESKRALKKGDFFYESDISNKTYLPRAFSFDRPFGIPVRYHDYKSLIANTNVDFVEFHLSYQDLDLNLSDFIDGKQQINFAVHSPELFSQDHILDLSSTDKKYLERSIKELNRVCEVTRKLKEFFPKTKSPLIVINAGGFSDNEFLNKDISSKKYEIISNSLTQIDQSGVEIIIQTMPPFPWHFGGQRFHNTFVDPKEIKEFCQKYNYRICYDISHSMMACNFYNWDLINFTEIIGEYVAHMHIVDAKGIDGEGIQIGKGDVDFKSLSTILDKVSKDKMFIPEIWQGHKNNGEGFWHALDFLENYF